MFKATLSDISLFRESLTGISELISEGTFKTKKDGIYLTAADPTMVTLVNFKFLATLFDEYKVDDKGELSISLDSLLAVLKRAKPGDKVTFSIEKDSNKLNVLLKGASTRDFTIPLIEIDTGEPPEMKLQFPAELELKCEVLDDGLGDASVVTDTVILGADPGSFSMGAKGDLSQTQLKIEKGSKSIVGMDVKEAVEAKYSLDYFKKIAKSTKLADSVKVQFGKDYPVRLTFRQKDKLEISYVLAPRVED